MTFSVRVFGGFILGTLIPHLVGLGAVPSQTAVVFYDALPGQDRGFATELATWARGAGYPTHIIGLNQLTNSATLKSENQNLVILPNARRLPVAATTSIESYLKTGGNLLALGVPAWKPGLFPIGQQWLSREDFEERLNLQKPIKVIENFDQTDLTQWHRASNVKDSGTHWEIVPSDNGQALHVVVEKYAGWDNLGSPLLTSPFPEGHTLTCFRAKGAPQTKQLALEWVEQDGSRWIATVNLSTNWKSYAVAPGSFKAWESQGRQGGPQDRFNPHRAVRYFVGISMTHTSNSGSRHEYWLDNMGTAPLPFSDVAAPGYFRHPHLESFSPEYLFFPITTPLRIKTPLDPALTSSCQIADIVPQGLYAIHPRPQGAGYDQDRPWRWQPLLEAVDSNGDYRGAIGVLMAHCKAPFQGGVWATFTPEEPQFYRRPEIRQVVQDTINTIHRGLFLKDGGSEFFTVFEDQPFRLGATVGNLSTGDSSSVSVRIRVESRDPHKLLFEREWDTNVSAGATIKIEQVWKPELWPGKGCMVNTELRQGVKVIDRLSHELNVWKPKAKPSYISIQNGEFQLDGKTWKAHGVNYMPSSGIGISGDYFEHWIGRGAYDPAVVQRDLNRIKAMGLNSVSIFIYYRSLQSQHLLDFLRRCDVLGLRVNQSLRPGDPMNFRWNEIKALIQHYHLAQNDTVFAYDLAWEPSHYDYNHQRKNYTAPWNQWIEKRYGSLTNAEAAWAFAVSRANGSVAIPTADQLFKDGRWRKMSIDYRLFLDGLLHERYAEARRLVMTVDPNHLVSFRMQFAGDPTHTWTGLLPYDCYGLRDAVDIWEPEAYGHIGSWEIVRPGLFTAAYARLCDPRKPVMWAEMGNSVWDMQSMTPSPEKLVFTAQYYRDFYRMMTESGADGIFYWWYPAGFRLNENSDYGIINPDGTEREISAVIRNDGARFLSAPKPPFPNYWISVDRDRDARGLNGIYENVKDEYWRAVGEGKVVGLKWRVRPGEGR